TRMSRSRLPASHSALTKGPGGISNPGGAVLMTRPLRRAAGRRLRLLGHGREGVPAHAADPLRAVRLHVDLDRVARLVDRRAVSQGSAQPFDDLGDELSVSRVVLGAGPVGLTCDCPWAALGARAGDTDPAVRAALGRDRGARGGRGAARPPGATPV